MNSSDHVNITHKFYWGLFTTLSAIIPLLFPEPPKAHQCFVVVYSLGSYDFAVFSTYLTPKTLLLSLIVRLKVKGSSV